MSTTAAHPEKHTNRLTHETSPYLLQHAHNPVDWYPWGEEAFDAARKANKPIFLSIGYSTCYWCHVMERECFENEQIAREVNHRFINIKVDREERPDVDQLYMTAVQILSKHGGWPLNVFLTPDLRPFYGGTYFPPTDVFGRPGFLTVLRAIEDSYRHRLADVEQTCSQLLNILQQLAEPRLPESPITISNGFIDELVDRSIADYDAACGGFGAAPKFPRQTLLEMLLVYLRQRPAPPDSPQAARQVHLQSILRRTLDAMADGGIRDQLGGAFHRYSTDAQWLIPHFEIMLYDQAMLAWVYTEASRQLAQPRYAAVARGILDFLLREMTSPQGAFYTAFDAEVDTMEGATYLWTPAEIAEILSPDDAKLFAHIFGLDRGPNFADPHHGTGQPDKNILYLPQPLEAAAAELNLSSDELESRLAPMRQKLYDARRRRKQPLLDTKIITSWNALAIRALAFAGKALDEPRYTKAASAAAEFLLNNHLTPDGGLWRGSRDGMPKHPGFLDDYAFFTQALLELHNTTGEPHWREQASMISVQQNDRFGDPEVGGVYFTEEGSRDILVRQKIGADSPLPSGNAVAAMNLLRFDQEILARDTIAIFAQQLEESGESASALLQAAILYLRNNEPIAVSPGPWRGQPAHPPTPEQTASTVVSVEAWWVAPNELHLRLAILQDFHLNAHQTTPDLTPTTLALTDEASSLVDSIDYPPGEDRSFAFASSPLRIYDGAVTVVVRFKNDMTSRRPLHLALTYQPCSNSACFPAVTKQFQVNTP